MGLPIKLEPVIKSVAKFSQKHAPQILTGVGVGCMVGGTVLAVSATPKALQIKAELDGNPEATKYEYAKLLVPYVPSILLTLGGVCCILGGQHMNAKRIAALTAAYKIAEESLANHKEAAEKIVGKKKAEDILQEARAKKVEENPLTENTNVIATGKGSSLCYDALCGRYFLSSLEAVKSATNELNHEVMHSFSASLNDFYGYLGLPGTRVGELLGWNSDSGGGRLIEFVPAYSGATNGEPCLIVDFDIDPLPEYHMFH